MSRKKSSLIALAPLPLLLAEADLNAAIQVFNTGTTIPDGSTWIFSFTGFLSPGNTATNVMVSNNFYSGTKGGLYASYADGTLNFENTTDGASTGSPGSAVPTTPGALINSALTFGDYAEFPGTSGPTFYGFEIRNGDFFGWAEISTSPGTLTIHRWAVETQQGVGIIAGDIGAIPEPADFALGLGALAAGAAVIVRKRRQDKEKAEAVA